MPQPARAAETRPSAKDETAEPLLITQRSQVDTCASGTGERFCPSGGGAAATWLPKTCDPGSRYGVAVEQSWTLRPATADDGPWLAQLKARAMRPDLERLGLWDPVWARQRFVDGFVPANTRVIVLADGTEVGCVAVRPERTVQWIEHFYLDPGVQGRGIGGQVLRSVLAEAADGRPFRLAIDRGSDVRRLYERHGFVHVDDDANGVDQIFERPSTDSPVRTEPHHSRGRKDYSSEVQQRTAPN
jgi:GNAT superfamily N-acetyltransferase